MSIFKSRGYYKPFDYPWAYQAFTISEQMHWLSREVPLNEDVLDWSKKLTDEEKFLLTNIFRFFTQADCDVASGYIDKYLPVIKPPELRMMLSSFAAREAVHIQAYSTLIDEVGIPEIEYSRFTEYKEMSDKHDYMFNLKKSGDKAFDFASDLAIFSAFGEGLQLFSSFVILLNFTRFGLMKGMGQIVSWSIRDESHHVDSMIKLFHELKKERPSTFNSSFTKHIQGTCKTMVELENKFIDLAFGVNTHIKDLSKKSVKEYIRYIANIRLKQLGISPIYIVEENPLDWVDYIVYGKEHTNFFENKATDYSKASIEGSWEDAFN
jgi:ribonucleoside-diphosphate reductase beta chain